jgi:hypothetical protein
MELSFILPEPVAVNLLNYLKKDRPPQIGMIRKWFGGLFHGKHLEHLQRPEFVVTVGKLSALPVANKNIEFSTTNITN